MAALVSISSPVSRVARSRRIADRPVLDQSWRVQPPPRQRRTHWQVTRTIEPARQELAG